MTPGRRPAPRAVLEAGTPLTGESATGTGHANSATAPGRQALLTADFVSHPNCPVFHPEEKVALAVRVRGRHYRHDRLSWMLSDWNGAQIAHGEIPVTMGERDWGGTIDLGHHGSGWFQVHLHLERLHEQALEGMHKDGPAGRVRATTMPAGVIAYAVLPAIEPLPLQHIDDSRFGAQGGESRDHLAPAERIWPLVGMRWAYRARRPFEIAGDGPESFKPVLDPQAVKSLAPTEAEEQLCLLVDAHSLPRWLTALPTGTTANVWAPHETHYWQSYGVANAAAYSRLIGQVAAEQAALRQAAFTRQKNNYYEIHWEPNWHWKGSDEEFIHMYKAARAGIRANDPQGLLLGANYGVLDAGNRQLERLLIKGLGQHLDGIVTHTYYLPMLYCSPEAAGVIEGMRTLTTLVRRYLPAGAPILNSEWGVNCNESFARRSLVEPAMRNQEAAWFLRSHLIALGEGARTTFFYETIDADDLGGWGLFFKRPYPHRASGDRHVSPKPVFAAIAAATRLLEGTTTLVPIDYLGDQVWGYAFNRADQRVLALWSRDERFRTVLLPCGAGPITLHDPMGNPHAMSVHAGVCEIPIGPHAVFVKGVSAAALPDPAGNSTTDGFAGCTLAANCAIAGKAMPLTTPVPATERRILYHASTMLASDQHGTLRLPADLLPGRGLLVAVDAQGDFCRSQVVDILPPQGDIYLHGVKLVSKTRTR